MTLQETFKTISDKAASAEQRKAEFSRKLEAYERDKAQGEADKAAALEAKDEQAYKTACRAIDDAEAGIEFNSICLHDMQRQQLATDEEEKEIIMGLRQGMKSIYIDAINAIEKAFTDILDTTGRAIKQFKAIDEMEKSWKTAVMNDHRPTGGGYTIERRITIETIENLVKTRLKILQDGKRADIFFKGMD